MLPLITEIHGTIGFAWNAVVPVLIINRVSVYSGIRHGDVRGKDLRHRPCAAFIMIVGGVRQWFTYKEIRRASFGMFGYDDAALACRVHPLEIPDGIIVGNMRPEYVAPPPR